MTMAARTARPITIKLKFFCKNDLRRGIDAAAIAAVCAGPSNWGISGNGSSNSSHSSSNGSSKASGAGALTSAGAVVSVVGVRMTSSRGAVFNALKLASSANSSAISSKSKSLKSRSPISKSSRLSLAGSRGVLFAFVLSGLSLMI